MENQNYAGINKLYLSTVLLLMFVFPCLSVLSEFLSAGKHSLLIDLIGKWFVFWSIGIRLFTAGLRQAIKPAFTAQSIFRIKDMESFVVVKELGFANICLGSIGIASLFIPSWRLAAAFAGGLFMGIAGINHIIKMPDSSNELLAMISDIFISLVMSGYLILSFLTYINATE